MDTFSVDDGGNKFVGGAEASRYLSQDGRPYNFVFVGQFPTTHFNGMFLAPHQGWYNGRPWPSHWDITSRIESCFGREPVVFAMGIGSRSEVVVQAISPGLSGGKGILSELADALRDMGYEDDAMTVIDGRVSDD